MEIEKQVCSLELAKRLKELGSKQFGTLFAWADTAIAKNKDGMWKFEPRVCRNDFQADLEFIAAFSVAELGDMLPQILLLDGIRYQLFMSVAMDKQWFVVYANEKDYEDNAPIPFMMFHTEADARAKMLIYLLENKLITNP